MSDEPIPVACTLTTKDAASQVLEWQDLHRHVHQAERVPDGITLTFDRELAERIADLARREMDCCGFLTIATGERDEHAYMTITSSNPDAAPIIDQLAGLG